MERFLNINWNPVLEDIIDEIFVDDERMLQESVMHRILRGSFTDPFQDIKEDYKSIDIVLFENLKKQSSKSKKGDLTENANNGERMQGTENAIKSNSYVPGKRKLSYNLPRVSKLSKKQQALCLRVLLQFSGSQKPGISETDKEELHTYLRLKDIINQEQDEFLEFIKSKWDSSALTVAHEEYLNLRWQYKMQRISKLPRYYVETVSIPFVSTRDITVKFISVCLETGLLPRILFPTFTEKYVMNTSPKFLQDKCPVPFHQNINKDDAKSQLNTCNLPVSEDKNCECLAERNNIDLVISSAGLNCLANNVGSNYCNPWILPVVIRTHNGKNIIYIDKPVPPAASTVFQKNYAVYKYVLKQFLVHPKHMSSKRLSEFSESQPDTEEVTPEDKKTKNAISYKIFSIGAKSVEQNELMKDTIKEYRILVRTKIDGFEKLSDGTSQFLKLAPKLEHQCALGAEAITLEEGLKQWISLIFRPDTSLARVRIAADNSEVVQIERRTATSISNEVKRLYNVKVEDSLTILHNIVQTLINATPGRYIIRHTFRNGAFAVVYKETESMTKNVFDLRTVYENTTFVTIPDTSWPTLDKVVVTPALKFYERMPAMYLPSIHLSGMKRVAAKGKLNGGMLRRSQRKKKHKT